MIMPLTKKQQKIADTICGHMEAGMSLREACKQDGTVSKTAFGKWLAKEGNEALIAQYVRASESRADAVFEEIFEISDNGKNDWMQRNGEGDAGYALNGEHVQRSRLRVDARKWALSKMMPKKYGDKLQLGGDPDHPLVTAIERRIVGPKADD